ncbi:MAG: hypothetical protein ACTHM7_12690 [Ginsengibacter sp.]
MTCRILILAITYLAFYPALQKVVVIVYKNNGNHRSADQRQEEGFIFAKKVGRSGFLVLLF